MMQPDIDQGTGILLVENKDSRLDSSIHMLFMRFDLAVIWINSSLEVVDVRLARKWQPYLVPACPASYILEIHPQQLSLFEIGDKVEITYV